MKVKEFSFENVNYKYKVSGQGPEKIVVFHGFDQNIHSFDFLIEELNGEEFTIYVIGLIHHDSTCIDDRKISQKLNKKHLIEFFENFCKLESIISFQLIGYSLGARIAVNISLVKNLGTKGVILLAPDGICINKWYSLMTNFPGELFFRIVVKYNSFGKLIKKAVTSLNLVSHKEKKLMSYAFEEPGRLKKIYRTWISYSKINFSFKELRKLSENAQYKVTFVFGKYDKIIGDCPINKLNKIACMSENLLVIEEGHNLLRKEHAKLYQDLLKKR